ncbi:hypothetical protein BJ508DRAFT_378139 [Ascobolus immersus RN42]|uniref:Uncharacterized protein n=1 Tax=Ascobolus immersus RN42 TaxID=1160509 RepID=A0A3N4HZN7_ASCIM|nr:hypothetical protein BJ508DRAFT_378139 [Ascobolus immersus RN42]
MTTETNADHISGWDGLLEDLECTECPPINGAYMPTESQKIMVRPVYKELLQKLKEIDCTISLVKQSMREECCEADCMSCRAVQKPVVFISGQSGIGKSTFLTWLLMGRLSAHEPTVYVASNGEVFVSGSPPTGFLSYWGTVDRLVPAYSQDNDPRTSFPHLEACWVLLDYSGVLPEFVSLRICQFDNPQMDRLHELQYRFGPLPHLLFGSFLEESSRRWNEENIQKCEAENIRMLQLFLSDADSDDLSKSETLTVNNDENTTFILRPLSGKNFTGVSTAAARTIASPYLAGKLLDLSCKACNPNPRSVAEQYKYMSSGSNPRSATQTFGTLRHKRIFSVFSPTSQMSNHLFSQSFLNPDFNFLWSCEAQIIGLQKEPFWDKRLSFDEQDPNNRPFAIPYRVVYTSKQLPYTSLEHLRLRLVDALLGQLKIPIDMYGRYNYPVYKTDPVGFDGFYICPRLKSLVFLKYCLSSYSLPDIDASAVLSILKAFPERWREGLCKDMAILFVARMVEDHDTLRRKRKEPVKLKRARISRVLSGTVELKYKGIRNLRRIRMYVGGLLPGADKGREKEETEAAHTWAYHWACSGEAEKDEEGYDEVEHDHWEGEKEMCFKEE